MSYSQGGEEEAILRASAGLKGGYVLDVGAGDGVTFSNSRALIEAGWRAVLFEPDFEAFAKLHALYGSNPDVLLFNVAMAAEWGLVQFQKSSDCGLYSSAKFDERFLDKRVGRPYYVSAVSADDFVTGFAGAPDVITIDTEGGSFELLKALPIGSWVPIAICVEHDGRAVEAAEWGRGKGYRTGYLDQQNIVLVR